MHEAIKRLIDQEASVAICADDLALHANLYALGLTPYAAVRLLVAIERAFEVEFPRHRLNKRSMSSIAAIAAGLDELAPKEAWRDAA